MGRGLLLMEAKRIFKRDKNTYILIRKYDYKDRMVKMAVINGQPSRWIEVRGYSKPKKSPFKFEKLLFDNMNKEAEELIRTGWKEVANNGKKKD